MDYDRERVKEKEFVKDSHQGRVQAINQILVLTRPSTKVHSTQNDLPRQVKTIPELRIMHAQSNRVSPHSSDILGDTRECTHAGGR
jgi:hypothetical protein